MLMLQVAQLLFTALDLSDRLTLGGQPVVHFTKRQCAVGMPFALFDARVAVRLTQRLKLGGHAQQAGVQGVEHLTLASPGLFGQGQPVAANRRQDVQRFAKAIELRVVG